MMLLHLIRNEYQGANAKQLLMHLSSLGVVLTCFACNTD